MGTRENFFPALFCWENTVEAWERVPKGFRQVKVNISDAMSQCMPAESMTTLKTCVDRESTCLQNWVQKKAPAGVLRDHRIPWISINGEDFNTLRHHNEAT